MSVTADRILHKSNELLNTPVLYVEESIKTTRSDISTKYDTDWRMYIIYRYGKYLFCGSRQPSAKTSYLHLSSKKSKNRMTRSEKKKNKHPVETTETLSWPVISMSFNYPSELYNYMTSLFGHSKLNITLYISPKPITEMDDIFVHPSHENMKIMDRERVNRKMELVGYDRVKVDPVFFKESNPNKMNVLKQMIANLDYMGSGPSGMGLSFTCDLVGFTHTDSQVQTTNDEDKDNIYYHHESENVLESNPEPVYNEIRNEYFNDDDDYEYNF